MIGAGDADSSTSIQGGTDGTKIGNVGDSLKVVTQPSSATTTVPSWSKKLRYEDMNAGTGGVARGTSIAAASGYVTVYSYSGSGYFAGFLVNVETFSGWTFRFQVDGDTIFELLDTDVTGDALYDLDDTADANQSSLGISKGAHDRFLFHSPLGAPLYYATSVVVSIKRTGATKKFQAGLAVLSKET